MKDFIRLTYLEKGKEYPGKINRAEFINQMEHMVKWFPNCNENAITLCELLPTIDTITINKDIIDTQEVPFIQYTNIGDETPRCLKFRRTYKIIWDFFMHQCELAKKNN